MTDALKNLIEFNNERLGRWFAENCPALNGIACPECGAELYDTDNHTLTVNPPMRNVHCSKCSYSGFRYD